MKRIMPCTALITSSLLLACGCANKKIEHEPRVDTRPMVNEIHQAETDWVWISAQDWLLVSIDGSSPIPETVLRLRFKAHTWLEGEAGCNRFTASYSRMADSGLQISEILSTRMYCAQPEGIMQQEARFFHLLQSIDSYHAEPDHLDLYRDDALVLSFEKIIP